MQYMHAHVVVGYPETERAAAHWFRLTGSGLLARTYRTGSTGPGLLGRVYSDSSHTAYASASLFRFSAVSLMLDVVSHEEW